MIFTIEWRQGAYYVMTAPDQIDIGPFRTHDQALAYVEQREAVYEPRLPA